MSRKTTEALEWWRSLDDDKRLRMAQMCFDYRNAQNIDTMTGREILTCYEFSNITL